MLSKMSKSILVVFLVLGAQARATVLPDACGDDKVKFDVKLQKDQHTPSVPSADKALIVFEEAFDHGGGWCIKCDVTARVGLDGAWAGAAQGNSWFAVSVTPGEHHVCADWQSVLGRLKKKVGLASFTAEPGKIYYYRIKVNLKTISKEYVEQDLELVPINEDEGKYGIKASALSDSQPRT
jgi:hypothetical protein